MSEFPRKSSHAGSVNRPLCEWPAACYSCNMALNQHQLLHTYLLLHKVFPEDLHIARPLIQMLQQNEKLTEARALAMALARRMLAVGKAPQAVGFLALCRQLDHPDIEEIDSLTHIAQLNMGEHSETEHANIRQFDLVEQLSDMEARDFIAQATIKPAAAGHNIVAQGESSKTFYLILGGEVEIRLESANSYKVMNTLHAGDFFGEFACVYGLRRSATVTTVSDCMLLEFPDNAVDELIELYPMAGDYLIRTVKRRMVHAMTYSIPAFAELPEADRQWMAEESAVGEFQQGEQINFATGSCNILLIGQARRLAEPPDEQQAGECQTGQLNPGAIFGSSQQAETITADEHTLVCRMPDHIFHSFMNLYGSFEQHVRQSGYHAIAH